ncbi:hypothetical protein BDV96DRAFT_605770 [Lophiotrema nucula]|uniref:KAR9-domain-containing protein n=1 Tax=Lophiotrema nucula TaxID=690887 RepID=A0A6A5YMS3_9PLEO|nr:hypothetical protein BDV96DRAFT_605770 [Lophiotrema nucula]
MATEETSLPSPPPERASSPEPWISPSLALNAVPQLDRSVSTASSVSSVSGRSASSRLSDSGIPNRRRGYIRPEGTQFSQSAKNRDSVMNLGTIAHLQYYFARTGLLDAATGRVAKSRKNGSRTASGSERPLSGVEGDMSYLSISPPDGAATDHLGEGFVESPVDETGSVNWDDGESVMLPPTVSTYKMAPVYVPPPPDMTILRRELRESLDEAAKVLRVLEEGLATATDNDASDDSGDSTTNSPAVRHSADAPGWYEIQGLNLLDVVTLAIRAAKNYYTAHEDAQRLYSIKSERQIRKELYDVLDVLKRLAMRNFANGVQRHEVSSIQAWVAGIGKLLDTEEEKEKAEHEERESWIWRQGDWTGREREREWSFLKSFDPSPDPLPSWTEPEDGNLPTAFLEALQNGLRLVHLHNALVKKSRRQFEEIKQFHTDTAKPYRCADNLRFWVKAAELRWDTKLDVDVMGVVYGTDDNAWKKFDAALLQWSRSVREEIIAEWKEQKSQAKTPTLQIDPHYEAFPSTTPSATKNSAATAFSITPPGDVAARSAPLFGSSSLRTPSTSPRLENRTLEGARKVVRNVSPGLLARMKFLNHGQDSNRAQSSHVGRIPESQLKTLDEFHRERSIRIERRGTAWSGTGTASQAGTPLIPQLTGDSVPALAMDQSPPPGFESDRSSFVSTSDRVLPSDSEAGELPEDTQKYRLPDITKTKSLSQAIADTDSSAEVEVTRPPTPPPKDTPPAPADEPSVLDDNNGIDVESYFQRRHLSRANSIYTLSRASFSNQIQQLTSITLPEAQSLQSSLAAIPTSTAAGRALHQAANQIKLWMSKASEVLNGLDAEDDVEWAAAAGKEGLAEVDVAIRKFEDLVNVYITAIEDLQARTDIASLPNKDLTTLVTQMEEVVSSWQKIKQTLKGIKVQVEIAMEWEELWNLVLGEIGAEIDSLSRLVFEMEERRHRAITDSVAESAEKFDIAELETIVEETPRQQARIQTIQNNRFSLPPAFTVQSPISPIPQIEKENSRLLSLFAKLQPLRASLDFLPMRLSSFHVRASKIFPSACDELLRRKDVLEKAEKKLEADADALREELGEDKWVHSFRQAGSKAFAMYDSLMKSIQRLRQIIDEGDDEKLGSRTSTYKDKREHYPPSMKRVLELIDIEMKNRATVNGEILRIQQDVRQKVTDLEQEIQDMDEFLEEFTSTRKLRDSVSTVFSQRTEASLAGSAIDTPGSSPASSIIMSRKSSEYGRSTPAGKKSRQPSASSSKSSLPPSRRYSSLPTVSSSTIPRKSLTASRLETIPSSVQSPRDLAGTPTRSIRSSTPSSDKNASKPRWNGSTNMRDTVVGHNFKPLSVTTPSPFGRETASPSRSLRSVSSHSAIPVRSPLSRTSALSPPPHARPSSTTPAQQPISRRPLASNLQSPSTPAKSKTPLRSTPGSSSQAGTPASGRRVPLAEEDMDSTEESPIVRRQARPASAMNSRRTSMLPTPKQRTVSGSSIASLTGVTPGRTSRLGSIDEGRTSRASGRKSSMGFSASRDDKPRWQN